MDFGISAKVGALVTALSLGTGLFAFWGETGLPTLVWSHQIEERDCIVHRKMDVILISIYEGQLVDVQRDMKATDKDEADTLFRLDIRKDKLEDQLADTRKSFISEC